jgi:hypothetical protein
VSPALSWALPFRRLGFHSLVTYFAHFVCIVVCEGYVDVVVVAVFACCGALGWRSRIVYSKSGSKTWRGLRHQKFGGKSSAAAPVPASSQGTLLLIFCCVCERISIILCDHRRALRIRYQVPSVCGASCNYITFANINHVSTFFEFWACTPERAIYGH